MMLTLALLGERLRPYAKALTPAGLTVVTVLLSALSTGDLDRAQLEIAVAGLLAAFVTYWVTNAPTGVLRFAKGIAPALLTVTALAAHVVATGEWSSTDWRVAATGLLAAAIAAAVPNAQGLRLVPSEQPDRLRAARARSAAQEPPRVPTKRRGER